MRILKLLLVLGSIAGATSITSAVGGNPNPLLTTGDIWAGTTNGAPTNLPAGASGTFLGSNGIGIAPTYQLINYSSLTGTVPTWNQSTTGNAATATKWKTAQNLTIGSSTQALDGTAALTYSLAAIGAEPAITAGTTAQYWRGDKSWQTFPTTWAWGSLTGIPANVTSFGSLANTAGALTNNGSGTFSYAAYAPAFTSGAANLFWATPNGSSGVPSLRAIVAADVPTLNQSTTGTAANITATSNSTLTTLSVLSLPIGQVTGTINATQVNGAAVPASKTIVGTNASSQIVDASSATLANSTTGSAATLTTGRTISASGDATGTSAAFNGSAAVTIPVTLTSTITAGGPTGGVATVPVITYDAKGRLTAVSTATITAAAIGAAPNLPYPDVNTSGNVTGIHGVQTASLGTGLLKNTTATGVPSIAGAADIVTTLGSQSANQVFASPIGSSGNLTVRSLAATDIPALAYAPVLPYPDLSTAGKVTGITGMSGTGPGLLQQASAGSAVTVTLTPSVTSLTATGTGTAISAPNGAIVAGQAAMATWTGSSMAWFGQYSQNTTGSGNSGFLQYNDGSIYMCAPSGKSAIIQYDNVSTVTVSSSGVALGANTSVTGTLTANATGTAISAPNGVISSGASASTGGNVIGGTAAIGTAGYNSTYGWAGLTTKNGASLATDFGVLFDATGSPNLNSSAASTGNILAAGAQIAYWNSTGFSFAQPAIATGVFARTSYNRNTTATLGNVTVSTLYSVISLEAGTSNPTSLASIPNGTVDGQQLTLIQNAPATCVVSSTNLVATFSLTTGTSRNLTWNAANAKWL